MELCLISSFSLLKYSLHLHHFIFLSPLLFCSNQFLTKPGTKLPRAHPRFGVLLLLRRDDPGLSPTLRLRSQLSRFLPGKAETVTVDVSFFRELIGELGSLCAPASTPRRLPPSRSMRTQTDFASPNWVRRPTMGSSSACSSGSWIAPASPATNPRWHLLSLRLSGNHLVLPPLSPAPTLPASRISHRPSPFKRFSINKYLRQNEQIGRGVVGRRSSPPAPTVWKEDSTSGANGLFKKEALLFLQDQQRP